MEGEREALLERIEKAAEGLLYPSETDAPLEPFVLEEEPSPEVLRKTAHLGDEAPVEAISLEEFLEPLGDEAHPLAEVFGALEGARAYRVGKVDIAAFALGRHASGAFLGVRTRLVET